MSTKTIANDSGATTSIWMRAKVPAYDDPLPIELTVDVCVIGAGISGLSTAYALLKEGKTVVVLDDGPIGGGETGRTTAHLASAQDDRFTSFERHHTKETVRLIAESHAAAIDRIESTCINENIQCGFRRVDGYLFHSDGGSTVFLEKEQAAARRAGLVAELVARAPLPGVDTGPAIRFARQGQFHPLAYLRGLARAIERLGGKIHCGVHVERVDHKEPFHVMTTVGAKVLANAVVVATNAPIVSQVGIPLKQAAYRSYVLAFSIPKGSVPLGLYWDTEDPYHYARLAGDEGDAADDTLIVGGEDHKTGQARDVEPRYEALERWARRHFPDAKEIVTRWSGQVLEPLDGLGFIGQAPGAPKGVYIITGDSGQGMTHGTLGAMLLTDLVAGRDNAWAKIYDPSRKAVTSAYEFVKETLNSGKQYLDWFQGGDASTLEAIPPGSGAIVRKGAKLLAVYRDEMGACHARSAACPHLGGVVAWNAAEKSWDCPVHGSRFDVDGRVLNGPSAKDLACVDLEAVPHAAPDLVPKPAR